MGTQLFVKSEKVQWAVSLINQLDDAKFSLLLPRILQKIHLKEPTFTKDEESKLELALAVNQEQLQLILETLTFFFQQAIYHLAKPGVLNNQLLQLGVIEDKATAIVQAWVANARNVTDKFKKQIVTPKQLTEVDWQLRLQMSQSTLMKMKRPLGVLELTLKSEEGAEKVQMEFSHEELYSLYNKLEKIQSQLDALR